MENKQLVINKLFENKELVKRFTMPFRVDRDNEYQCAMANKLEEFCTMLAEYNVQDWVYTEAKKIKTSLCESLKLYYDGDLPKAQNIIFKLVNSLDDELAISTIADSISFGSNYPPAKAREVQFFRGRVNNSRYSFVKEEMVNLPNEKRHLADTYRFSILGMPCLYVGTTSYVCWLELGRPEFGTLNISPIYLKSSQKILNLTLTLESIFAVGFSNLEKGRSLLILYMLEIVTSFVVTDTNRKFKSEYVLSQLTMLACKKRKVNGIAYFSKKEKFDYTAIGTSVNVAIIPDMIKNEKIPSNIEYIVDSFNYAFFQQINFLSPTERLCPLNIDSKKGHFEKIFENSTDIKYSDTQFYEFDKYLCTQLNKYKTSSQQAGQVDTHIPTC